MIITTTPALLRLWGKKNYIINSLNALQLEISYCTYMGTLTGQQVDRIKKKAKQQVYLMCYYKKRYGRE